MVKFQEVFGNFLWLGLFLLAGLSFIVITQTNNDALQPISENPDFNETFSSLTNSLDSLEDTSSLQYDQFTDEQPKLGFGSIVLFGIVSAGKTFGNVTLGLFVILIKLPLMVLGLPSTLISVIITWVIIILIVTLWILYKLGG